MASSEKEPLSDGEEEINILVLGEPGVGKSTFINLCLNYMKYESMEDVVEKGLQVLVPAKINMADVDKEFEGKILNLEVNVDEKYSIYYKKGLENKNIVLSYTFRTYMNNKKYKVQFLDTPGLVDQTNCDLILEYLMPVERIRAFCILVKPNDSNIDVLMNNSIVQIIMHLSKLAIKNVIFIFTNTKLPNSMAVYHIERFLERIKKKDELCVNLFGSKQNSFCFEDKYFQNVAALKYGLKLDEQTLRATRDNWRLASCECRRLFSYMAQLKQQQLMDVDLSQLVSTMVQSIEHKISRIQMETLELSSDNPNKEPSHITPFQTMAVNEPGQSPQLEKKINILVLGKSGVGKSTFINSCLNYMKYTRIEDAIKKGLQVLVPAKVNMADINKEYEGQILNLEVKVDEHYPNDYINGPEDENVVGSYTFLTYISNKNCKVQFIDTPCLLDKTNCDLILKYVAKVQRINAFCIVLNPTSSNIELLMNDNLIQIITHLGQPIIRNVIFIITNTKGKNIQNVHESIKKFLARMEPDNKVSVPVSYRENIFRFENKCFKNVAALNHGFKLKKNTRRVAGIDWQLSSEECKRLFFYIARLEQQLLMDVDLSIRRETQKSDTPNKETSPMTPSQSCREEDINILLIGESGVGKSTFINSCINYLEYPTLEDAVKNELKVLIPAKIDMIEMGFEEMSFALPVNDEYETDDNEVFEDGKAGTQDVRTYIFPVVLNKKKYKVHFIDTPGIGDERGIERDQHICNLILGYLAQLKQLHGVCILLKPTNSKLDILMNYCLIQILSKLESSAVNNVTFIFTNTRGQNYSPGQTTKSLKKLLKEIEKKHKVCVPFDTKKNVFCFDNEGFRSAAAQSNGFQLEDFIITNSAISWTQSFKAFWSLLHYMIDIEPHDLRKTISVNEASTMVSYLSKPVTEILQLIEDNIKKLEQHSEELSTAKELNQKFLRKMYTPKISLRTEKLDGVQTVCTHVNCTSTYTINGLRKVHFKEGCCSPCNALFGYIYFCRAFSFISIKCKKCTHDYSTHQHITYKTEVYVEEVDQSMEPLINCHKEFMELKEELVSRLKARQQELKEERQYLLQCCAVFDEYVNNNSIMSVGSSISSYLKYQIAREKSICNNKKDDETVVKLQFLLDKYESEKTRDRTERPLVEGKCIILPEEIEERKQKLFQLKHFGRDIEKLYNLNQAATRQVKKREKHVHGWFKETIWDPMKDSASTAANVGSAAASATASAAANAASSIIKSFGKNELFS